MRYWPLPSVTAVRIFSISSGLDASTVTPGSTAPDESLTTPVIDACANAAAGTSAQTSTSPVLSNARTSPPPLLNHPDDAVRAPGR